MMKLLKNRLVFAALLFLLLNVAGGFAVMAPILVVFRNELIKSAVALRLWPVIRPDVIAEFLINNVQSLSVYVVSAIVIFALYSLLWTYFSAGIYGVIINRREPETKAGALREFLRESASLWPGFVKVALLSILLYAAAAFIGLTFGQIFGRLWAFLRIAFLLVFMLVASTYLQVLKARIASTADTSLRAAIRATRPVLSKTAGRLLVGNFSVMIAGVLVAFIFWMILKFVRGLGWSVPAGFISAILEQAMVFAICLAQAIRINYNNAIIKRGTEDALGGTQLGGV